MNAVWSPEAIADLLEIRKYIAENDPSAAQQIVLQIVDAVETRLVTRPEIGRPGRVPGTRELVVPRTPFIIPYRVKNNAVQILRVYHAARKWPGEL